MSMMRPREIMWLAKNHKFIKDGVEIWTQMVASPLEKRCPPTMRYDVGVGRGSWQRSQGQQGGGTRSRTGRDRAEDFWLRTSLGGPERFLCRTHRFQPTQLQSQCHMRLSGGSRTLADREEKPSKTQDVQRGLQKTGNLGSRRLVTPPMENSGLRTLLVPPAQQRRRKEAPTACTDYAT